MSAEEIQNALFVVLSYVVWLNEVDCQIYNEGFGRISTDNLLPYAVRGEAPSSDNCSKMQEECRVKTYRDHADSTHVEVSCYCYFHKADVSGTLHDLMNTPCPLVPKLGQRVTYASLNITQCAVEKQTVPLSLLLALRRSDHLQLLIADSAPVRFPRPDDRGQNSAHGQHGSLTELGMRTVNVHIVNSKVSGIDRGLVDGCKQLRFLASNSDIGVLGDDAFTSHEHEDVVITIQNSNVTKISKNSVRMPTSGRLLINNSRIGALDEGSISGSGDLSLISSKIGLLSRGSVNMIGLSKLEMQDCSVAAVEQFAVISSSAPPEPGSNLSLSGTENRPVAADDETRTSQCHAIFSGNHFMSIHSMAFSHLCKAKQVTWHSNEVVDALSGPVVLESDGCPLPASSIVTTTKLPCNNCSLFDPSDIKMCNIYVNSWCSHCDGNFTCSKSLEEYLTMSCPNGPDKIATLTNTCRGKKTPRSLGLNSSPARITYIFDLIAVGLVVVFVVYQFD
ncbi:uncharacterized protein LOC108670006 isoform X2 [Hyalella azteca]|uniref:Uncharacterized protein LOC108670006 isoform X2 n=1 Tax=Hyalella azteca TaxID=294128 RepID=A0A8B7NH31_HYAAZ|nr:uncharacterized protein LOC108670006 isoform X2 [Hyalella azteca]